jgi:hypothetical protein
MSLCARLRTLPPRLRSLRQRYPRQLGRKTHRSKPKSPAGFRPKQLRRVLRNSKLLDVGAGQRHTSFPKIGNCFEISAKSRHGRQFAEDVLQFVTGNIAPVSDDDDSQIVEQLCVVRHWIAMLGPAISRIAKVWVGLRPPFSDARIPPPFSDRGKAAMPLAGRE